MGDTKQGILSRKEALDDLKSRAEMGGCVTNHHKHDEPFRCGARELRAGLEASRLPFACLIDEKGAAHVFTGGNRMEVDGACLEEAVAGNGVWFQKRNGAGAVAAI